MTFAFVLVLFIAFTVISNLISTVFGKAVDIPLGVVSIAAFILAASTFGFCVTLVAFLTGSWMGYYISAAIGLKIERSFDNLEGQAI